MLVHRRVTPALNLSLLIHQGGERHCKSKLSCPRTQHYVLARARTRNAPKESALAMRPPRLYMSFLVNIQLLSFPLVHTVDCSVQTEAIPAEAPYAYDNPAAIDDEYKGNELVLEINCKPRVVN